MKTLSIFSRKALLLAVAAVTFALPGRAQLIQNTYLNVDWQVTVPLGSAFADKASGWGMNFEGGYFVTPEITVGAFISYQTNIESIGRQTLQLGSGAAMTTAQKHTLFELPFGVVGRYNFLKGSVFQPYAGLGIGAALHYNNPEDPQSVKMQELIAAKGLRQAVSEITSIPATDPVIEEIAAATAEVEKRIR